MRKYLKYSMLIVFVLLFHYNLSFGQNVYNIIQKYLNDARQENVFISPDKEELQKAEKLFYKLLTGEDTTNLAQECSQLNFSIRQERLDNKDYIFLFENSTNRTGRGFYVFNPNTKSHSTLMIPHGLYDYHTSEIGVQLMVDGNLAATVFNTVHRYGNKKGNDLLIKGGYKQQENNTWDMADLSDTYFTAFTKAFVKAFPKGNLLQIHGFSQKKRKTSQGKDSDFIISSGTRYTTDTIEMFGDCLKIKMPGMVRLYPNDVTELGGTQNSIGSLLRSLDHKGFIHIEISRFMREKIKDDKNIRGSFLRCIHDN